MVSMVNFSLFYLRIVPSAGLIEAPLHDISASRAPFIGILLGIFGPFLQLVARHAYKQSIAMPHDCSIDRISFRGASDAIC